MVKDVEEVLALSNAVGANLLIIVTTASWTDPVAKKAAFEGMDLRLISIKKALKLVVPDYWRLCPTCEKDCIISDNFVLFTFTDFSTSIFFSG